MAEPPTVAEIISEVDVAIGIVTPSLQSMRLKVIEVEVDLATTVVTTGGFEFKVWVITAGAAVTKGRTQKVTAAFVPAPRLVANFNPYVSDLGYALTAIADAVSAAENYDLSKASVEMAFTVSEGGKVQAVISGEANEDAVHTVCVRLGPED